MTSEEQKIIDIKVKYEDAIYGIIRFQEKMQELKKTQAQLDEQLKKGEITWDEWAKQTEAASAASKQYKENVRVLRKEMQNNLKTEQEQEGSLKSLRAQLSNATKAFDELSRAERQGAKGKELQQHINAITKELKQAEEETERYYRNVGNYYGSIMDAMEDLQHIVPLGGGQFVSTITAMSSGLDGIIPKIKAFGTTLLGLLANPVFLVLAGITGVGMAFKFWYDYNKGLTEASRLTTEFSGLTGREMQAVRNEIAATASAMGADFKDTLATADFLVAQYGITWDEAIQVIKDGFAAGANLSGDMLQNMQRYAPAFKDMGLEANQLAAVLAQTRSGIFTQDGMDAIVMAGKKLREMSDTTKKSLEAVGIDADKMSEDMANGNITAFQAIQQVAGKLKEVGINSKQAGNILKDVFGKQAVKAGGELIKSIETMSTDINEVKEQTGEWGKMQQELIDANTELSNVTTALFDLTDNGFEGWIDKGKLIATQTLTSIVKGVVNVINKFVDLYNESIMLRAVLGTIGTVFRGLWEIGKGVLNAFVIGFKTLAKTAKSALGVLEGFITLDAEKMRKSLGDLFKNNILDGLKDQWQNAKQTGADLAESVRQGFSQHLNRIEIPAITAGNSATKTIDTTNTKDKTTGGGGGNKPTGGTKTTTTRVDSAKLEAEKLKQMEKELQQQIMTVQMQYQDKMIQAKKMYLAGFYESDKEYEEDVKQLQKEEIARMLDVYVQAGAIGEQKALEMQEKLLDLQLRFKQDLEAKTRELIQSINQEFEESEKKRRELDIINGGTGEETDDAAKMERYKAFLDEKLAALSENAEAQKYILKELHDTEINLQADANKKKQEQLTQQQQMYAGLIGAIADGFVSFFESESLTFHSFLKTMLTELINYLEKAVEIAMVRVYAEQIASKGFLGLATAAALQGLIKVAFAGVKAAVKSFAVGGYVQGAGTATSDSIPARLSNGESVMTARATSMFSPLLSAFNQLGGGVPIVVGNQQGAQMGEDFLAAAIAKGFMMCPAPVVSVQEITRVSNRVRAIERNGRG